MEPARLNHQRYCARHGYTYACLEENIAQRSDPTWSKIPHVLILGLEKLFAVGWWMFQSHAPSSRRFIRFGVVFAAGCQFAQEFAAARC